MNDSVAKGLTQSTIAGPEGGEEGT